MSRDPLLAQIHIARKELGIYEDDYRSMLERLTGQRSAAGLTERQRRELLAEFRRQGWQGKARRPQSNKPYIRKVYALWGELKRAGIWREEGRASLRRFVKRTSGAEDPEWMTYPQAAKVIEALKAMKDRA